MSGSNNIDKIFKDGLSGYSEQPPSHIWDSIESHLSKTRKQKRILILWQSTAAAAIISIVFLSAIFYNSYLSNSIDQNVMANHSSDIDQNNNEPSNTLADQTAANSNIKTINKAKDNSNNNTNNSTESQQNNLFNPNTDAISASNNINATSEKSNSEFLASENWENEKETVSPLNNISNFNALIASDSKASASQLFYRYNHKRDGYNFADVIFADLPENDKNKMLFQDISLGGEVSPTYSNNSEAGNFSDSESGLSSITGGINLNVKAHKRWRIETGVYYAQIGQKFSNTNILSQNSMAFNSTDEFRSSDTKLNLQNSIGEIQLSSVNSEFVKSVADTKHKIDKKVSSLASTNAYDLDIQQELNYIEVPFTLKYEVINKAVNVALAGGVSTNFLVGNSAYQLNGGKNRIGKMENINSICYSTNFGFSIRTPLYKSIDFNFEPKVRYFINPVSGSSYKPYSLGIYTGISYRFK